MVRQLCVLLALAAACDEPTTLESDPSPRAGGAAKLVALVQKAQADICACSDDGCVKLRSDQLAKDAKRLDPRGASHAESHAIIDAYGAMSKCGWHTYLGTLPAEEPIDAGVHAEAVDADAIGVPSCDAFIKSYLQCIEKMPEAARQPTRDSALQVRDAWKKAANKPDARDALAASCAKVTESTKQATAAMGCEF